LKTALLIPLRLVHPPHPYPPAQKGAAQRPKQLKHNAELTNCAHNAALQQCEDHDLKSMQHSSTLQHKELSPRVFDHLGKYRSISSFDQTWS
jgi:hypothetical protein